MPVVSMHSRRVAHIGSKVRTNPLRSPSFVFLLVRFTSAPCVVIRRRLCSSKKEIWSNGTVNVCTKAVRWASPRPRLRCDQRRPPLPVGLRRVYKKSTCTLSMVSSSSIAQRGVCHSCKVLQSTMKRTKESDLDGQAKLFSFGFSQGRSGNQPEPTLLFLVHLSSFVLERVDKQSARRRTMLS